LGSSALNFAMVAQGGLDIYWWVAFLFHARVLMHSTPDFSLVHREIGCWPWDVCAGIVIAQEAGGLVTGSHAVHSSTKGSDSFGDVTEEILTGRKYLVVRAVGDSEVCE
jgi:myo-inositol-1(or 4)-monophosphatase